MTPSNIVSGFSPSISPHSSFTEQEIQRFKICWENGCDLKHDQHYNNWLKIYHPDNHTSLITSFAARQCPHLSGSLADVRAEGVSRPSSKGGWTRSNGVHYS